MCERCEDYGDTCPDCARRHGYEDAIEGEPYNNPYKNWDQSNCYTDGYNAGKAELERLWSA